jgi:hypothetical protein
MVYLPLPRRKMPVKLRKTINAARPPPMMNGEWSSSSGEGGMSEASEAVGSGVVVEIIDCLDHLL